MGIETKLQRWLAEAAEIEREILSCIDSDLSAAVGVAIERDRAHLRLVVDCVAPGAPRLRVRVIDRARSWWVADTWGLDATRPKHLRAALQRLDVRRAMA